MHATAAPALTALRRATSKHHQAIEAVVGLEGDWTLAHYIRILQGFGHFLQAWEPLMQSALPPHLRDVAASRSRLAFLQADLAALGCGAAASRAPVPNWPVLPEVPLGKAALGSLYVIEGSALGGQVIAKRLLACHGLSAAQGGAYFTGWGPRTGAMWRQFMATLGEELDADPQAIDLACEAACATFDALRRTFEVSLHERIAG